MVPRGARTTSAPVKPTTRQGTASSPRSSWAGCPSLSALANPVAIFCLTATSGVSPGELRVNSRARDLDHPHVADPVAVPKCAGADGGHVTGDQGSGRRPVEVGKDAPRPDA